MFLPWSFFTLNFFYLALELSVACAFTAVLARISRGHGGYVQSIRWIQLAGYGEMLKALWGSRKYGLRQPAKNLCATLLGSVALTLAIIGGKLFVSNSTGEESSSREVAMSTQFLAADIVTSLPAWSFPARYDASIEDTLARAFNSTMANPRASHTKHYRPHVSDYELACDRLNLRVFNDSLLLPNDGCATFDIYPPMAFVVNSTASYIIQTSKGRARAILPSSVRNSYAITPGMVTDLPVFTRVKYEDQYYCSILDNINNFFNVTRVAFTVSPSTMLTKCQLLSGHMISLSTTVIRFAVPNRQMFHSIATSIFGDQDELVTAMNDSVNNGTLTNSLVNELVRMVVMEVKIVDTQATALICVGSKQPGSVVPQINCAYTIANTLITKPRPLNPDIDEIVSSKNLSTDFPKASTILTMTHLPQVFESSSSYPMAKILNASAITATYMAKLGQNFIVDWDGSTMYVAYDTFDIIEGFDIPFSVFFLMCASTVCCFTFWIVTELCVEDLYTRSLFWLVSKSLNEGSGNRPSLQPFDHEKREFSGKKMVLTKDPRFTENETVVHRHHNANSREPLTAELEEV